MKNDHFTAQTSYFFDDNPSNGRFGVVENYSEKDIAKGGVNSRCYGLCRDISHVNTNNVKNAAKAEQTFVTLQFKIKSLKPSLIARLRQAALETNIVWNYCNEISHKAIAEQYTWLSHFDLIKLMTGDMTYSENNPYGFKVINNANTQCVAAEYVTRRNQFNKRKLKWRTSFGSIAEGRSTSWIPCKEEHINITYPYSYLQTTTKDKIIKNRKTKEVVRTETVVTETRKEKHLRVAGKNTPADNLYALYSLDNDSGNEYGLPSSLGTPTITVLGTHLKIFNEEYLGYYLYHLGALVKSATITENTIGEWFVNFSVAIDKELYREKHFFGKLKIPRIAPREKIGLDPGAKTMVVASDGTEYYANGTIVDDCVNNPEKSLGSNPPPTPFQAMEDKIKEAQRNNDRDQMRRLYLKVKNQIKDSTSKAALDIARKAQWINMGDLKITAVVKNKTVTLSEKDMKKYKSNAKRQAGREKQQQKEEQLKIAQQIKENLSSSNTGGVSNSNSNSNKTGNTKKRKGLGKSLLGQGIGQLKSRLGQYSQMTGRGYKEVNEAFTTQECCNCGLRNGPRGLKQLGVRIWVCGSDHQVGSFDPAKVIMTRDGCGTKHLRDHCSSVNVERVEDGLTRASTHTTPHVNDQQRLTPRMSHNGQASEKSKKKTVSSKTNQLVLQNTTGLSGSSQWGKNRK